MKKTKDLFNIGKKKDTKDKPTEPDETKRKSTEEKRKSTENLTSPRSPIGEVTSPRSQSQKKNVIKDLFNKVTGQKDQKESLIQDKTDDQITSPLPSPKGQPSKKNLVQNLFSKVTGQKEKSPVPNSDPIVFEEKVKEPQTPKEEKIPEKETKNEIEPDIPVVVPVEEPTLTANEKVVLVNKEESSSEKIEDSNTETSKKQNKGSIFGKVVGAFSLKKTEKEKPEEPKNEPEPVVDTTVKPEETKTEPEKVVEEEKSKPKGGLLGIALAKDLVNKTTGTITSVTDKTKDAVVNVTDKTKESLQNATDNTTKVVVNVTDKTKEVVVNVAEKTKENVEVVTEKVVQVKDVIVDAVDEITEAPKGNIMGIITSVTDKIDKILQGPKYDEEKFFKVVNDIKGVIPKIQESVVNVIKALAPEKVFNVLTRLFKLIKEVPIDKLLELPNKIAEVAKEFLNAVKNREFLPKSRFAFLTPLIQSQVKGDIVKEKLEGFLSKFEDVGRALFAGIPFDLINTIIDFIKSFSQSVIDGCCDSFNKLIKIVKEAESDIAEILKSINILNALKSIPKSLEETGGKVKEMSSDMKNAILNTKNLLKNFAKTTLELANFQKIDFAPLKKVFSEIAGISKAFSKEKIDNCIEKIKELVQFIMKSQEELAKIFALINNSGCVLMVLGCCIEWPSFLEKAYVLIMEFGKIIDWEELKGIFNDVVHLFTESELFNTDYNELLNNLLSGVFDKVKDLLSHFNFVQDQVKGFIKMIKKV